MSDLNFPDIGSSQADKAFKINRKLGLDDDVANKFIFRAIKRCVTKNIKVSCIPQFICDFMAEYFGHKASPQMIKVALKEKKITKGGLFIPFVVPFYTHYGKEFKNIFTALGIEGRYNIRKNQRQYKQKTDWLNWTDRKQKSVFSQMASTRGALLSGNKAQPNILFKQRFFPTGSSNKLTPKLFNDFGSVDVFENNEIDPFLDFLKNLPEWDKKPRLSKLISSCFKIHDADKELAKWTGKCLVTAMVKRTLEPGCKFDYMIIFKGSKGLGKSSFFNYFFPHSMDEDCFTNTSPLGLKQSRKMMSLGHVLIECAELTGFKKSDVDELKNFLTTRVDSGVKMYGREQENVRRKFVMVGTVNDDTFLPDEAENRRFIVLNTERLDKFDSNKDSYTHIQKHLQTNRQQLWAEAKHLWSKGFKLVLPDELELRTSKIREIYRIRNSALQEAVQELYPHLKGKPLNVEDMNTEKQTIPTQSADGLLHFRMLDLISVMPKTFKNLDNKWAQMEIASILKSDGFFKEVKRVNGQMASWWFWPEPYNPETLPF